MAQGNISFDSLHVADLLALVIVDRVLQTIAAITLLEFQEILVSMDWILVFLCG